MLKRPEMIVLWRHWFGRSLRPRSHRTHPVSVEGATMARRVPFPPSSIPAYIEQSMKLIVCLLGAGGGSLNRRYRGAVGSPKGAWYLEISIFKE